MIDLRPASGRMTRLVVGLGDDQLALPTPCGDATVGDLVEFAVTTGFVSQLDAPRDGRLFGPIVDLPTDASPFDRLLGLTGRDPEWRAPA